MPFNRFRTPASQRRRARPGDEVHRRGDGLRRGLRHRVRQGAGRSAPARRSEGRAFLSASTTRQACDELSRCSPTSASSSWPLQAPPCFLNGVDGLWCAGASRSARRASRTPCDLIQTGEIDLVINTPNGSSGGGSRRIDGYEIRTAAVMANIPCITTVQGLGAAVQGIEALRSGDIGVRSLQDWAKR